jgi:hypothetical protein
MKPGKTCRECWMSAVVGSPFCIRHQGADRKADKERKAANPVPYNPNSKAWRTVRSLTLFRFPQCAQVDEAGARCLQLSTEAHHRVHWPNWVAQGHNYLDPDGLVGLCRACHTRHTQAERMGTTVPGSFAPPSNEWSPSI